MAKYLHQSVLNLTYLFLNHPGDGVERELGSAERGPNMKCPAQYRYLAILHTHMSGKVFDVEPKIG